MGGYARFVQIQPLSELVSPDWADALAPQASRIATMWEFLRSENESGRQYLPSDELVLRAFRFPLSEVRVLIVGQDPYPAAGHAVGLSFAVNHAVRPLPRSLQNIYRELEDDLAIAPAEHGDLTGWAEHGVMLLNRVLTVQSGVPGSHRAKGWEAVTDAAVAALVARAGPLVAILWGRSAGELASALGDTPIISSAHPSPLSATRGFFGSRPFSRANASLVAQGASAIDWRLTP